MHDPRPDPRPEPAPATTSPYDAVVFAGGGNRCLWQAGFWHVAAPALDLRPRRVAAVSAGAAIAAMLLAGRAADALRLMKRLTRENRRNIHPLAPLRGRPLFPQDTIFRRLLLATLDGEALVALRRGPELRVVVARPPRRLGPRAAVLAGFLAYEGEKRVTAPLHPRAGRAIGFRAEALPAAACPTPEALADLIMASSCTPPFLRLRPVGGRPALDGGLVDNVPVDAVPEARRALVLLTRRYHPSRIPRRPDRTYVQPSRPIAVVKWDYTDPAGLQAAYDQGRADGEAFARAGGE